MIVQWARSRAERLVVAVGVAVAIAALGIWAQNASLVGSNYDDGIYAILAKAMAEGQGYVLPHLPGTLPGVKYPPVYPISLVPFWLLAPSQETALFAMKVANGLLIGLAAGLFVLLLIELEILTTPLAAAAGILTFASGSMMLVTSGLLSEPLYLVIVFATLLLSDKSGAEARPGRFVGIGVLTALAALTRMAGLALLAAVALGVWRRCGRARAILTTFVAVAALAPWFIFTSAGAARIPDVLVPRYGSYAQLYLANLAGDPLAAFDILATNIGAILQTLGAMVVPGSRGLWGAAIGVWIVGTAALGSLRAYRSAPTLAAYPWLYLGLISVWSFPPFRFLFILFPLLVALVALSVISIADQAAGRAQVGGSEGARWRWLRGGILAGAGALLVALAYGQARGVTRRVWDGAQLQKSAQSRELINWVVDHAEPAAVIAFEFDPLLALYTDRTVVPNNYSPVHPWYRSGPEPAEPLARLLREMRVDYLAVRRDVPAAAANIDALIQRYPGSLQLIHVTDGGVLIFRTDRMALSERWRTR